MRTERLIPLIEAFEAYSQENDANDLQSFAFWLLQQKQNDTRDDVQLNREVGYYLNRVNRYARYFAKQSLDGLDIGSLDEFNFITAIKTLNNPSKSEVYEKTITELATGQQMMRRLVTLGLVEELEDKQDKRIKRVRLTTKGDEIYVKAFDKIETECNIKFGSLDAQTKQNMLQMLEYLDKMYAVSSKF